MLRHPFSRGNVPPAAPEMRVSKTDLPDGESLSWQVSLIFIARTSRDCAGARRNRVRKKSLPDCSPAGHRICPGGRYIIDWITDTERTHWLFRAFLFGGLLPFPF